MTARDASDDQDALDWLRLARTPKVGPTTFKRLLARFGSAGAALDALPELARRGGARAPLTPAPLAQIETEYAAGVAIGATLMRLAQPPYPPLLAEIFDPPPILWTLGDPIRLDASPPNARPPAAIVGSRTATANGARFAEALAHALAEAGVMIVSGLARGVDAAAHRGALAARADATAAVVAGGVDHVYPQENADLRMEIIAGGAVLSEMPIGFAPQARHFPRRNRIISGLALGVAVIEAAERSGSLITARLALEQGREVMAAPGHPLDPRAAGGNALIRDGAVLIRNAEDVLEALDRPLSPRAAPSTQGALFEPPPLPADASATLISRIVAQLSIEPTPFDALARAVDSATSEVSAALLELELAGRVETHPGGGVSLAASDS